MATAGIQTKFGKAFEYACVISLYHDLYHKQEVTIEESPQLLSAKKDFESVEENMKESLLKAADAAVRVIKRLEPQLWSPNGNEPLYLSIQPDSAGIKGDVRDVLCIRNQNGWEIGLSCKHNHHAVKHSRLSATIDFGKEWLNVPCSDDYFSKVVPLFDELKEYRDSSKASGKPMLWEEVGDKAERYYIPILQAFMEELKRIDAESNDNIPEALIRYLLGRYDFYKVITDDKNRTTRVEAINLSGTLNVNSGMDKSITKVPLLKMPSKFYHIDFKKDSNNTIEVVCDEGWQISMRIHSASSRVEPSLKFDVQLVSFPSSVYTQTEPWEDNKTMRRISSYLQNIKDIIE
ncbi:MAG: HaeIII family restriction endonuclease [Pseudobutyrivibrio sp.]|nr:HaeIII family restriction endonuclease [Pseudobutyrivibrio sp.]